MGSGINDTTNLEAGVTLLAIKRYCGIHILILRCGNLCEAERKQGKSVGFDSCDRPNNLTQIGLKSSIFQPVFPWNLMDDLEKIIGHFVYIISSFVHHLKPLGEFKVELLSRVALKFDGWPWKTIGHLFNAASCSVHHFVTIGEFKLELQSGNANLGPIRWFLEPCDLEIWRMN